MACSRRLIPIRLPSSAGVHQDHRNRQSRGEQGGNEVLVKPAAQKELHFIARMPGRYPLICADHDWDGMVGEITVE